MIKCYIKLVSFVLFMFFAQHSLAQIGIGTTSPTTQLDVDGALSLREGPDLVLNNGVNNDISLGATPSSLYKITGPTGSYSITGIIPVSGADGQLITIVNNSNGNMSITHDATSTAANRIACPGERDLTLSGRYTTITLKYIKTQARWIVVNYVDNRYGDNVQKVKGTTDISTTSTTYIDMPDMSITFTPNHSTVYLTFSASGHSSSTTATRATYTLCRLVKDGTVLGGTASVDTDFRVTTSGTVSAGQAWNQQMTMFPVDVTPGVPTTLKMQWRMGGNVSTSHTSLNNVNSEPDRSHRSLTIYD